MSRPAASTLVVFTLGPRTDTRRRPLLGPKASGLELGLRRACMDGAFDAGRTAGLRLAVCSPEPLPEAPADARFIRQEPGTFGERFAAAVAHGLGATESLVIVGGDVPGLAASHLDTALRGLDRDPETVVVGPARDGGFYLLATARPLGPVLREVRWCGRDTRKTLLAALARAGRPVVLLPPLRDLDRPADVEVWLAERRPPTPVIHLWSAPLRRFLSDRRRPSAPRVSRPPSRESFASILGRAPPLPASS